MPLVVIIDDDFDMLQSLEALIQSLGYRAQRFTRAEAFIEGMSLGGEACCIVSDVQMPGMNGFELSRRVAQAAHPIPVILISGTADEEMHLRALRAGARCFFGKPLDIPAFVEQLDSAARSAGFVPPERA